VGQKPDQAKNNLKIHSKPIVGRRRRKDVAATTMRQGKVEKERITIGRLKKNITGEAYQSTKVKPD